MVAECWFVVGFFYDSRIQLAPHQKLAWGVGNCFQLVCVGKFMLEVMWAFFFVPPSFSFFFSRHLGASVACGAEM